MKFQTSYAGYGADPDEEELLGALLAQSPGPAPAPQQSPDLEPPEPMGGLQAPLLADRNSYAQPAASSGGPPAYTPEPMQHVPDRGFGVQDVGMLAAIIGAALVGGKHGRQAIPGMIGSYAQSYGQDVDRRDARNQQIDMYNAQQAERHNPRQQYFEDQRSAQAATELDLQKQNLLARNRGLDLQTKQEERIAAAAAREAAIDPVQRTRDLAQARADVELDLARKRADVEVGTKEMLGIITGNQRRAAAGGPGAMTPKKAQSKAIMDGINNGTIDPVTLKPKEKPIDPNDPNVDPATGKPYTPAERRKRSDEDLLREPVGETEVIPGRERDWQAQVITPGNRDKIRIYEQGVNQTIRSLTKMKEIRDRVGAEGWGTEKSNYDALLTAAIGGYTQIGQSGVLNGGEFARYKDFIPGIGPKPSDVLPGDVTSDELQGVIDATKRLASDGLGSVGLRFKSKPVGGGAKQKAGPQSSFGAAPQDAAPSGGGKRTVTVTTVDGQTDTDELTEDEIRQLRANPKVRSVQ